jgi:cell division protease FtsH
VVIDHEVRRFIEEAEDTARRILKDNLGNLHKLAKALLEREIIDSRQVDEIIGTTPGDPEPVETPEPAPSK